MFLEINTSQAKLLIGLSALVLAVLASLTFIFGVSPLITLTILLSFLIVLLAALGCSLHLREIEKLEEAEALEKMRERVAAHMQLIHEILLSARERVVHCEGIAAEHPGLIEGSLKNITTARRIVDGLEERLESMTELKSESSAEAIVKIFKASEAPLQVRHDMQSVTLDAERIPDLESHLWRDTLDMLLLQVEKQIAEKQGIAA
jgi:hypothetical protein